MDRKYNFHTTEKELEKFWEEQQIYRYRNGRDKKFSPLILRRQP